MIEVDSSCPVFCCCLFYRKRKSIVTSINLYVSFRFLFPVNQNRICFGRRTVLFGHNYINCVISNCKRNLCRHFVVCNVNTLLFSVFLVFYLYFIRCSCKSRFECYLITVIVNLVSVLCSHTALIHCRAECFLWRILCSCKIICFHAASI